MTGRLRRLVRPLRQSRSTLVATALLAALTLALCVLPGVGVLNYYSALVLALAGGLVGGLAGLSASRGALARGDAPWRAALDAGLWVAGPPPLLLLLNAFRVTNCDPLEGLAFYLVGAAASILLAAQVGAAIAVVARRRRVAWPLWALTWFAAIAADLWHLYHHPAVFAFNPFVGFFSGSVYDTVIEIDARLLLYRVNNVAQLAVLWSAVALVAPRGARPTWAALAGASGRRLVALGLAVTAAASFYGLRGEIGYEVSRAQIERELGGRVSNARLTLVYDRAVIGRDEADRALEDHTYRLEQLDRALGVPFPHPITSYLYGSVDQKRRLMGAARVYIAKPWLEEIHLHRVAYGEPVVLHELSHVVLGQFAPPPLHLPTSWGVLPHMALVEGAAEALEWDTGELNPHQWSAALRRLGVAPSLATLLGPDGFYLQPSHTAYTLSGSFIRWLLETRGAEPLCSLYRDADFDRAYGRPVTELIAAWERWVDGLDLPAEAQALAAQRFAGKAIFYRTCPLEVARLEQEAGERLAAGEVDAARDLYERVAGFVPDDPDKRLPLLRLAADRGERALAEAAHAAYLAVGGRNAATDAHALVLVSDARWRDGEAAAAARGYVEAAQTPQDEDRWRNTLIKALVAGDPAREPILGPYLLSGGGDDDEAIAYLIDASLDLPGDPVVLYLLARRHALTGRHAEAARLLQTTIAALSGPDPAGAAWRSFARREAWRLLGHARFALGELGSAAGAFDEAARIAVLGGQRDRLLDWAARARWKAARDAGR